MEFYVTDTGIGIPKDRQHAIFERFVQADIEDRMAYQGAGLGLAITKAYVEMLGGKIWVESDVGQGSTFHFSLPCPKTVGGGGEALKQSEPMTTYDIRKLNILVVEEVEVSELLMLKNKKQFSRTLNTARTGLEAIKLLQENPDIELIMMDIRLLIMDGLEAAREIREFNTGVVILAQTAYALAGDCENALEAGCNDYITKPLNSEKLKELIKKCFQ